ncbi:hypothetical protein BC834DRAFT_872441 [Gloeopeniophorella convolvens]|nr:hypothetical protein BC834DRAFT_872441 [Gloeopeniophorella convolvens]
MHRIAFSFIIVSLATLATALPMILPVAERDLEPLKSLPLPRLPTADGGFFAHNSPHRTGGSVHTVLPTPR